MEFKVRGTACVVRGEPCGDIGGKLADLVKQLRRPNGESGLHDAVVTLTENKARKAADSDSGYRRRNELADVAAGAVNGVRGIFLGEVVGRGEELRDMTRMYVDNVARPLLTEALMSRSAPEWCKLIAKSSGANFLLSVLFCGDQMPLAVRNVAEIYRSGGWWVDYRAKKGQVHCYITKPKAPQESFDGQCAEARVHEAMQQLRRNLALVDWPEGSGIDGVAAQESCLAEDDSHVAVSEFWQLCSPTPEKFEGMLRQIAQWCISHGRTQDGGLMFGFGRPDEANAPRVTVRCASPYRGPLVRVGPGSARVIRLHNGVTVGDEVLWYPFDGEAFEDLDLSDWWEPDDDDPLAAVPSHFPVEWDGDLYGVHPLESCDGGGPRVVRISHDTGRWGPAGAVDMGELFIRLLFAELREWMSD